MNPGPGPGPGDRDSPPQGAPSSSSATSLPPISTFYDFTSSDTVSEPEPRSTIQHAYLPPIASDQASFSTWITPANTAELADQDLLDDENSNYNNNANADYDDDTNFVYEHGRRYHANADGRVMYPLPNDESEQERDDMKHKLALWMMHDKLFYAPVEDALTRGGMVIDLGEPCLFLLLLLLGRNEQDKNHICFLILLATPRPRLNSLVILLPLAFSTVSRDHSCCLLSYDGTCHLLTARDGVVPQLSKLRPANALVSPRLVSPGRSSPSPLRRRPYLPASQAGSDRAATGRGTLSVHAPPALAKGGKSWTGLDWAGLGRTGLRRVGTSLPPTRAPWLGTWRGELYKSPFFLHT